MNQFNWVTISIYKNESYSLVHKVQSSIKFEPPDAYALHKREKKIARVRRGTCADVRLSRTAVGHVITADERVKMKRE